MCYGTFFDIENLRIGPNPLVQGKDPIIINYVATLPHTAEYYVYTVTGELILNKNFQIIFLALHMQENANLYYLIPLLWEESQSSYM